MAEGTERMKFEPGLRAEPKVGEPWRAPELVRTEHVGEIVARETMRAVYERVAGTSRQGAEAQRGSDEDRRAVSVEAEDADAGGAAGPGS